MANIHTLMALAYTPSHSLGNKRLAHLEKSRGSEVREFAYTAVVNENILLMMNIVYNTVVNPLLNRSTK